MKKRTRIIAPVGKLRDLALQMPFRLAAMRTHPLPRKISRLPVHCPAPKTCNRTEMGGPEGPPSSGRKHRRKAVSISYYTNLIE